MRLNYFFELMKSFLKGDGSEEDRIIIEQFNRELEETMEEVRQGKTQSHEEVVKMSLDR